MSDWEQHLERDWVIEWLSVVVGAVVVVALWFVMWFGLQSFITWDLRGVNPSEPKIYVVETAELQNVPMDCIQSCPQEPELQPASGYLSLRWELK